jgi:transmembrane sensor
MTAASEQVEQQAAERLIRLEANDSPDNWARLELWLSAHPRHRAAFLRLSLAWIRADRLASLRPSGAAVDANSLGRAVRRARALRTRLRDRSIALATAAACAIVMSASLLLYLPYRNPAAGEAHESAPNQLASFALADGSGVVLNAGSRLLVRYAEARRELTLVHGEAAFDVKADPLRPFALRIGATSLRVLGTSFSVRVYENGRIVISVTEGKVAIESDGVLEAGDVATIDGATIFKRRLPLDVLAQKLAWTRGRLFFDGETLGVAAAEFNRYNQMQLEIADPRIGGLRIFGTFEATHPQTFVAALEEPFGIQSRAEKTRGGTTIIRLARRRI